MSKPIETLSRWPDYLEVHENETGQRSYVCVVQRRNSRQLNPEQYAMIRHLEDAGMKVVIRVGNVDLTPAQFESQGVYSIVTPQFTNRQQYYNERYTLKNLREELERTNPESPQYDQLVRRIKLKEEMIQSAAQKVTPEQLHASDEALRKLERLAGELTLQPDNLDLRSEIIKLEQRLAQLKEQENGK